MEECLDVWLPVRTVPIEDDPSAELHVLLFKSMDPDAVLCSHSLSLRISDFESIYLLFFCISAFFFSLFLSPFLSFQGLLSVFGRPMKSVPVRMAAGDILLGMR